MKRFTVALPLLLLAACASYTVAKAPPRPLPVEIRFLQKLRPVMTFTCPLRAGKEGLCSIFADKKEKNRYLVLFTADGEIARVWRMLESGRHIPIYSLEGPKCMEPCA